MTFPTIDWKDFVEIWLQSTVVLFLWCGLYSLRSVVDSLCQRRSNEPVLE